MPAHVSVVVPVYNGAVTIGPLVGKLVEFYRQRYRLEIVLVNDGSRDDSRSVCRRLVNEYPGIVRFLDLSRNFGEHQAVLAGLRHTEGDCAVIMDDDFQNPPEDVDRLVRHLQDGDHDVVYSAFESRQYPFLRNLGSSFNDRVAALMLRKPRGLYLSSFKCINRFLINEICRYEGPYPYIDGLILRVTDRIGVVACQHHGRAAGRSGYTLRKLASLWLNMFTNFSILPLRVAVVIGFGFAGLGAVLSVQVVIEKLLFGSPVGWPSLAILIMMFAGIQLMVLGLIGEYLGRLFLSSNRTPQSVVRESYGFEDESAAPSRERPVRLSPALESGSGA